MPTMALVRWAQQAQWTPSRHHMTFLEHRDFDLGPRSAHSCSPSQNTHALQVAVQHSGREGTVWSRQLRWREATCVRPIEMFPALSSSITHRAMCVTAPAYSCPAASSVRLVAFGKHSARREQRCLCVSTMNCKLPSRSACHQAITCHVATPCAGYNALFMNPRR